MNTDIRRLFVCTNQKSGVGDDVARALKKELKSRAKNRPKGHARPDVRIQTCNCFDLCKQCKKGSGAVVVGYPGGTVYGHVRPAGVAEVLDQYLHTGHSADLGQP